MRKNYFKKLFIVLGLGSVVFSACQNDDRRQTVFFSEITGTKGIYILNEGNYGKNNSSITYYDVASKAVKEDYYKEVNGRVLGETANDLKQYGSKMYCVVSGIQDKKISYVDVINVATGKSIKRIPFNGKDEGYIPRSIAFYKNKAYVSRYDGVISRIDTASLAIDGELQVKKGNVNAQALEGLAVANGKLYVAGTSHFSYPNSLEDKVVVIDLATFKAIKQIEVHYSPFNIVATDNGDLLVASYGEFGVSLPKLQKISSSGDNVTATYDYNVGPMTTYKNQAYLVTNWNSGIFNFDVAKGQMGASFITDGTALEAIYGVTINMLDESVVLADAKDFSLKGEVFIFNKEGKKQHNFNVGFIPKSAVFNYSYKYGYKIL